MSQASTIFREIFALYCMIQTDILLGGAAAFAAYYDSNDSPSDSSNSIIDKRSQLVTAGRVFFPIGACADLYLIERFGRKTTLQCLLALASFSWILTAISNNFLILFTSRLLISFLVGVTSASLVYISEMTKSETRKKFYLSIFAATETLGFLIINLLEYLLGWRIAAAILAIHFAVTVALTSILPESKYWHMMKNNEQGALKSAMWFNGYRKDEADEDLSKIRQQIQLCNSQTSFLQCIKTPPILKLFASACLVQLLRLGTGFEIFIAYSVDFWGLHDVPYNFRVLPIIFECINLISALLISITIMTGQIGTKNIFICFSGIMSITAIMTTVRCIVHQTSYPLLLTTVVFIHMLASGALSQLIFAAISEFFPATYYSSIFPAFCAFTYLAEGVYVSFFPLLLEHAGFVSIQAFFLFNATALCLVSSFLLPKPAVEVKSIQECVDLKTNK